MLTRPETTVFLSVKVYGADRYRMCVTTTQTNYCETLKYIYDGLSIICGLLHLKVFFFSYKVEIF